MTPDPTVSIIVVSPGTKGTDSNLGYWASWATAGASQKETESNLYHFSTCTTRFGTVNF